MRKHKEKKTSNNYWQQQVTDKSWPKAKQFLFLKQT